MKILARTKDLTREEWLRIRTRGIGGSDVSILAGINPYKSIYELWKEKTGQSEPSEGQSEFAYFGSVLEPIVKAEFMKRTGLKVRAKNMILQSTDYPFMIADLDGIINDNGEACIFEAKTASEYKLSEWKKGVPKAYVLQVQHYMAVTDAGKTHIAAIVGGNHFFHYVIERDEELIREIIAMEKEFWERNVLGGMEPLPDGSDATTAYLNAAYAKSSGSSIQLPPEALAVFDEYDALSQKIEELNISKEAVCNQLKVYLKENESGYIGDRRISWKEVHSSGFDKKRLEREHPELYEKYITQRSYRRLSVA